MVLRNLSSSKRFHLLELYEHQKKAVEELKNGSILVGNVGSGKSRTALAFYIYKVCKFEESIIDFREPRDLYIITTAKKRDSKEWWDECAHCMLYENPERNFSNVKVTIDSWNNIKKYKGVYSAFFIFDEQRVVGSGAWVKAFLNIARKNQWILLSATPGDSWSDYIPVFVANGFYRNKTEFNNRHAVFNRFAKYPKIDRYVDTNILNRYRRMITVTMKDRRETNPINIRCDVEYNKSLYQRIWRDRWDIYDDCPIEETGKLFYLMRKVVNSDQSRIEYVGKLIKRHSKVIIFYNFTYELELLREALDIWQVPYSEWNGQKHEEIITGDCWAYLVQYTAGAEGWNCITTDTVIFYSQTYSYRAREQAKGRIDRMNTPYTDLYYYHLISHAPIDLAIKKALNCKKSFNERNFLSGSPVLERVSSPAQ